MPSKARLMLNLQWLILAATSIFSSLAIGFAIANQPELARLTMIPVAICFGSSCVLAYVRYSHNRVRREEIMKELDVKRDDELRDLFDDARKKRNLPPDVQSKDGYTAELAAAKRRSEAKRGGSKRK